MSRTLSLSFLALSLCACPSNGEQDAGTKANAGTKDGTRDEKPGDKAPPADTAAGDEKLGENTDQDQRQAERLAEIAAKRTKAKAELGDPDEASSRETQAKLLGALNEGRKLVKAGDYKAGIAKYGIILEIDPSYGKALGELGWAEFKAGEFHDAHAHSLRALATAEEPKRRAMLLYNLGRIAEARDQHQVAVDHYTISLELRPDETVARRLIDLSMIEDAAGDTPYTHEQAEAAVEALSKGGHEPRPGLAIIGEGLPSREAACKLAQAESWCGSEDDDADDCEFTATPTGDDSWGTIALFGGGMMSCWHPYAKTDAGWTVFELALFGEHGSEIDREVDTIDSYTLTNDEGSFLVIRYSDHIYERDWSWGSLEEDEEIPEQDATETEGVIICHRSGSRVACTSPITTVFSFSGADTATDDEYRATLTIEGDEIVISEVSKSAGLDYDKPTDEYDPRLILPAGRYSFDALTTPGPTQD